MGASLQFETRFRPRLRTTPQPRERAEAQPIAGPRPRELARRALNVLVAAVGILLTAPLMVLVALLVRATSRGPVVYRQTRVGLDRRRYSPDGNGRRHTDLGGKPFTIYKFRTMRSDGGGAQVWSSPDDPRVTPVGRVLRKLRLDELPQLFNVLRGEMNVVGPRPEQPEIFARMREAIDEYSDRQLVLPGITGWAQINHHYDMSMEDVKQKVAFDIEYLSRRSAVEDLKIMCRTLPVMILRKGAW